MDIKKSTERTVGILLDHFGKGLQDMYIIYFALHICGVSFLLVTNSLLFGKQLVNWFSLLGMLLHAKHLDCCFSRCFNVPPFKKEILFFAAGIFKQDPAHSLPS